MVQRQYRCTTVLYPGGSVHVTPALFFPHVVYFISQDYLKPLPLMDRSFDLLISLYAGGIARTCGRYLRSSSLLLTNNHHDNAGEAARASTFELISLATLKKDTFQLIETNLDAYFIPKKSAVVRGYVQQASPWLEYTGSAEYYLFRRVVS